MLGETWIQKGSRKGFLVYPYHLIATVRLPVNSICSIGDEIRKLINLLWGLKQLFQFSKAPMPVRKISFNIIKYILFSK